MGFHWKVGRGADLESSRNAAGLKALGSSRESTPPVNGWKYYANSEWHDDYDMECGTPVASCHAVSVKLSGKKVDTTYY